MRCPKCHYHETKVYDSRTTQNGKITRRRRECQKCGYRFTTMEEIKLLDVKVEKRSGQIVDFDLEKLERGIRKAFNKRNIDNAKINTIMQNVVDEISGMRKPVIKSTKIGRIVLKNLRKVDEAAYICYWAMFGNFETAEEFNKLLIEFQK